MTTIGSLRVELSLDSAEFTSALREARGALAGFAREVGDQMRALQQSVQRVGAAMTVGVTVPVALFGRAAVQASSDAAELQSAFDIRFRQMRQSMNEWAVATGDAMGRSTQEMQRGAIAFAPLLNMSARTRGEAAQLSQQLAVLAQDLSSMANTSPEEAITALAAALRGEADPIERYGILVNQTAVNAELLRQGVKKVNGEYTDQQKILARIAIIMRQSTDAQGDVLRTSGGLANQLRALSGAWEELKIKIGDLLRPLAVAMVSALRGLITWLSNLSPAFQKVLIGVAAVAAAMGPLAVVMATVVGPIMLARWVATFGVIGRVLAFVIAPVAQLIELLGGLVARIGGLAVLRGAFAALTGPIGLAVTAILLFKDNIVSALETLRDTAERTIGPPFRALMSQLGQIFTDTANGPIGDAVRATVQLMSDLRQAIGEMVEVAVVLIGSTLIQAFADFLSVQVRVIAETQAFVTRMTGLFEGLDLGISSALSGVALTIWNGLVAGFDAAINSARTAATTIVNIWRWVRRQIGLNARDVGTDAGETIAATVGARRTDAPNQPIVQPRIPSTGGGGRPRRAGGGGGASGMSAEERAARLEELRLNQELEQARAREDQDEVRRIERLLERMRLVKQYRDMKMSQAEAERAAEVAIAALRVAEGEGLARNLAILEQERDLQAAQLNDDYRIIDRLERQADLRRRIADYQSKGLDLAQATERAEAAVSQIEAAREARRRRAAEDEARSLELEVARERGDRVRVRDLERAEEVRRRARRIAEEQRLDPDDPEAARLAGLEVDQLREARLTGTWRKTFREGVMAAMNGDFASWLQERWTDLWTRSLEDALNSVADLLRDLLQSAVAGGGEKGGGGFLGGITQLIGAAVGGGGGGGGVAKVLSGLPAVVTGQKGPINIGNLFGMNEGGLIRGFGGIDQNVLSLNDSPIARVSRGEQLEIIPANDGGGRGGVVIHQHNNFAGGAVTRDDLARMHQVTVAGAKAAMADDRRRASR